MAGPGPRHDSDRPGGRRAAGPVSAAWADGGGVCPVLGGTALGIAGDNPFGEANSVIVWAHGAVAGLTVFVFMGWLQQTLLMLIGIAKNTASDNVLSRF